MSVFSLSDKDVAFGFLIIINLPTTNSRNDKDSKLKPSSDPFTGASLLTPGANNI